MMFLQGVWQQERIDFLAGEMHAAFALAGETEMNLVELIEKMNHHYLDDRCAAVSLRRYFCMGVFGDFKYERGMVTRL